MATFVVLLLLSLVAGNETISDEISPAPSFLTPTRSPTIDPNELTITGILPEENISDYYLPFQKITISFSASVSPKNLIVETNPTTELDILQGSVSNELLLVPQTTWPIGRINITIVQAVSATGERLRQPFTYSITTALPTLSPEELEDIHP